MDLLHVKTRCSCVAGRYSQRTREVWTCAVGAAEIEANIPGTAAQRMMLDAQAQAGEETLRQCGTSRIFKTHLNNDVAVAVTSIRPRATT